MDNKNLYTTMRYLAQASAVFLIFKYLPEITNGSITTKASNIDILMITVILMLVYILFENLSNMNKPDLSLSEKTAMCQNVCSLRSESQNVEKMTSLSETKNPSSQSTAFVYNPNDVSVSVQPIVIDTNKPSPVNTMLPPQLTQAKPDTRYMNGVITDDIPYDVDYNHLPMASGSDSTNYETGYSYMPPKEWYPPAARPPVCITDKQCPVCPVYTSGTPLDMKEWNESIKISPPDNINQGVVNKLNAGR